MYSCTMIPLSITSGINSQWRLPEQVYAIHSVQPFLFRCKLKLGQIRKLNKLDSDIFRISLLLRSLTFTDPIDFFSRIVHPIFTFMNKVDFSSQ